MDFSAAIDELKEMGSDGHRILSLEWDRDESFGCNESFWLDWNIWKTFTQQVHRQTCRCVPPTTDEPQRRPECCGPKWICRSQFSGPASVRLRRTRATLNV